MPNHGISDDLDGRGDQHGVQGVAVRQLEVGGDVGGDEQDEGVEGDVDPDPRADGEQHLLRVGRSTSTIGARALRVGLLHLAEQRALGDRHPDPQPDEHQQPLSRNGTRQPQDSNAASVVSAAHQGQDAVGQQQPDRHADLRPAGVEPTALRVARLQRHQHGAAPLAAEAEALHEAQRDQQDRRPDADRGVGRQQADGERGTAHQQQGHDQDVLAAEPVAVVAEDDAAERPGDEADGVGGEGEQRADERLEAREEQLVEHQRGGGAVDEEVVPLQRGADQARHDDVAYRRRVAGDFGRESASAMGPPWRGCSNGLDDTSPYPRVTPGNPLLE